MSRKDRGNEEVDPQLNLAPIMNMVVILIPLLLLSIVFLKVGVINASAPQITPGKASDELPKEPLNLTVSISSDGFGLATTGAVHPALPGCPEPGPTVCLAKDVDLDATFGVAKRTGDAAALESALQAYDWKELYGELARIKEQHADETTINITADSDVPYAVIVRVMDVARFKLDKETFASNSEFWTAQYAGSVRHAELFPDPVLAVVR